MRSGDDVLGPLTAAGLTEAGVSSQVHDLWPEWWADRLWHSKLPGRRNLFEYGPACLSLLGKARLCAQSDVVWVNGPASPLNRNCWFERRLIRNGKSYIFHLLDDWFSDSNLSAMATPRVQAASAIVVPTPPLKDRILGLFPNAKVLVFEEPIDIERVKPLPAPVQPSTPFIVWSGHFNSQDDLFGCAEVMEKLYAKHPFTLRIISRPIRTVPQFRFPLEWFPYDAKREAEWISGAVAAVAPLADTPYTRCKGGYKIKTYFAAGVPVVASPFGHHPRMIKHGVNGILANSPEDWFDALERLLSDRDYAAKLGAAARQTAVTQFSHAALMPGWASGLQDAFPSLRG